MGKDKEPSSRKVYSRNEFARIAQKKGWTIDKSRGKGGHWWFRKTGCHPFAVPEEMGDGLQEKIKKWLEIK